MPIGPRSLCVLGLGGRPRILWPWTTAALSFVILALAGNEAPAQNSGCARCGAPAMSSSTGLPIQSVRPKTAFVEKRRKQRWTLAASARRETLGGYGLCAHVRRQLLSRFLFGAGSRADSLEEVCQALCPNADVALYSFPFGGTIERPYPRPAKLTQICPTRANSSKPMIRIAPAGARERAGPKRSP